MINLTCNIKPSVLSLNLSLSFIYLPIAFIDAFEEIGGVDNLVEWARCNQTEFYRMLARIMPREIHADVNAGFTLVECNREIDEREAQAKEGVMV